MSLGPHFAQCADGKWYEDPTWFVGKRFFICFDEDEPPEIVIFDSSNPLECLQEAGFTVKRLQRKRFGGRCPPWAEDKFFRAESYFFEYKGTPPVPQKWDSVSDEIPHREGTYFS